MLKKWQQSWDIEKVNSQYGILKPNIGDWSWCRGSTRRLDVIMTSLRLQRVALNKYLYIIGLSQTNLCMQCNSGVVEDTEHFLITCQKYSAPRSILARSLHQLGIGGLSLQTLLGAADVDIYTRKKVTRALEVFIKASKRENKMPCPGKMP